jgi:hypothetical protein
VIAGRVDRGAILLRMLGRLVLAGLLAAGAYRVLAGYPRAGARYRHLSRREVAFLHAAGDAAFPRGGPIPASGSDADVAGYADRWLGASRPRIRVLVRLLFFLVEHATLLFPAPGWGGWRRFTSLSPAQRIAVLDGWRRSRYFPRRLVFTSLRAILTMGYFAHPPVLRQLRLAPLAIPTPVCEADLLYPPVGQLPEAIRYTAADLTPPSDGTPVDLAGPLHPAFAEEPP